MRFPMFSKPYGSIAVDDRGTLAYVPEVDFSRVKRFYVVENFSTDTIRAFHGHHEEEKFVYAVAGSAIVVVGEINPERLGPPERFILSSVQPKVLYIPGGYMNGFRPLEPGTKLMFFSTATPQESALDDERYPADFYGQDVWKVVSR